MSSWDAANDRYTARTEEWFRRSGSSGLDLPAVSLGMWHNFGEAGSDSARNAETALHENAQSMMFTAFDHGVTHFDLANNYGPPPGAAEERVGIILKKHFSSIRDELVVSSKAGYRMFDGPYQDGGGRKYLLDSCEASLRRLQLEYVDLFYHHRPDFSVPLEETMGALDHIVRSGRARYVGLSNYPADRLTDALAVCRREGFAAPVIHQCKHNLLERGFADAVLPAGSDAGLGAIVFCPLAQGLLTNKYLTAVPSTSRAATSSVFLQTETVTPDLQAKLATLAAFADGRSQSLAQLALSWVLSDERITSALIGASRPAQVAECCEAVTSPPLTAAECSELEAIAG